MLPRFAAISFLYLLMLLLSGCGVSSTRDLTHDPAVLETHIIGKQFALAAPAAFSKYEGDRSQLSPPAARDTHYSPPTDTLPAGTRFTIIQLVEDKSVGIATLYILRTTAVIQSGPHAGEKADIELFFNSLHQMTVHPPIAPVWEERDLTPWTAAPLPWQNTADPVPQMLAALHSPDWALRWHAARALASASPNPELLASLRLAAADPDPDVANRAAQSLAMLGESAPVIQQALTAFADNSRSDYQRACAAHLIGRLGRLAMPALLAAWRENPHADLEPVLDALAPNIQDNIPDVIAELNTQNFTPIAAATLLGHLSPAASFQAAVSILKSKDSPDKRDAGKLVQEAAEKLPALVPQLVDLLHDPDPIAREYAANALKFSPGKAALTLPPLLVALRDPDRGVRSSAVFAVTYIANANPDEMSRTKTALLPLLSDPDPEISCNVADTLLERYPITPDEVREPILKSLRDPDPFIRKLGANNAYHLGLSFPAERRGLREALRPLITDPDELVRDAANFAYHNMSG